MLRMIILSLLISLVSLAQAGPAPVMCNHPYALCASASCVPIPGIKGRSLCQCKVEKGISVGALSCKKRKPTKGKYGVMRIISAYSFGDAAANAVMQCSSGTPWADCLDAKCDINPINPSKAICTCKVHTTGAYITYGGSCNVATCKSQLWSGATKTGYEEGNEVLMKVMKLNTLPSRYCTDK